VILSEFQNRLAPFLKRLAFGLCLRPDLSAAGKSGFNNPLQFVNRLHSKE